MLFPTDTLTPPPLLHTEVTDKCLKYNQTCTHPLLCRHKLTSSKSHVHKSFADIQKAQTSCVHSRNTQVWYNTHSAVGTVTDVTAFAHTQRQQKMHPPLNPLHTHIKMKFSPPVYAEVPRWKWQMSEMRWVFVRLYRLMHPFSLCFLHGRAIIPCHLTPGLGQSFWSPVAAVAFP